MEFDFLGIMAIILLLIATVVSVFEGNILFVIINICVLAMGIWFFFIKDRYRK